MAVIDADGRLTGAVKPISHLSAPIGDMRRAELAFPFDIPWLPGGGTGLPDAMRCAGSCRSRRRTTRAAARIGTWSISAPCSGTSPPSTTVCAEYRVHGANAYELDRPELDLAHVRDSIAYASTTTAHLARLADELGHRARRADPLCRRPGEPARLC